jgi:hypothetical protein
MDGFFKGDFGQFFTPREIIDFAVHMLSPKQDELVLDPACGSGGFLLHALDYVRQQASEYFKPNTADFFRYWHDFAQNRLFGIEINDEIARVAKMNMIIHDDGHTNVIGEDALERFDYLYEINRGFAPNRFDLVLTNPPFGAQVNAAERPYLENYYLGSITDARGDKRPRRSQKTEILFIERVLQFLKPGTGRTAIVLPDGILTNTSLQYVRDFILEHFQLLAVIALPQCAFVHFGASVKSSLLFMRKRSDDETPGEGELVFMAAPSEIGYDSSGKKCSNEFPNVLKQYQEFRENPTAYSKNSPIQSDDLICFCLSRLEILNRPIRCNPYMPHLIDLLQKWQHSSYHQGPLRQFAQVNPTTDTSMFDAADNVSFLPMEAIDERDNTYVLQQRTFRDVSTGYTRFSEGDILLAKITPCMQNGKAVIARGLVGGVGFGSTEYHVVRPDLERVIPEYLLYVLTTPGYLTAAQAAFTGSAGQQRVPSEFIENLPVPIPTLDEQCRIVEAISSRRSEARRLREEADDLWEKTKLHLELQLIGVIQNGS